MTVIGAMFTVLTGATVLAIMLTPVLAAALVLARGRARRRAWHHRLAEDADRQHAAMVRGNLSYGTFGRFPANPEAYR